MFITQLQAKVQFEQFLLDRQITTLKDYSASFNQLSSDVLSKVRMMNIRINRWESSNVIPDKELDEVLETMIQTNDQAYKLLGNLNTQRTMVHAIFGVENSPVILPSNPDQGISDLKQEFDKRILAAKTDRELAAAMREVGSMLEEQIIGLVNEENKEIENLALRIKVQ